MRGKIVDGEARDRLVIWIRRRMEEFGISMDALAASIQHDEAHPPLYRDARGHEWDGLGDTPDWLLAAKNAGVSPDFFRIQSRSDALPAVRTQSISAQMATDPRQLDLFKAE
jgi:hypothetical protein